MTKDELEKARALMRDLEQFLDKYAPKQDTEDARIHTRHKWTLTCEEFIAAEWEEKAIKSKLANLLIAPEDYYELNDNAEGTEKKEHFTWEEAMALEKKVGNGWRLPTRHEWALICEEFANDENGELSSEKLRKSLALSLSGTASEDGDLGNVGTVGCYWSRTACGQYDSVGYYSAYGLNLDFSVAYPQGNYSKSYGFTVRMVKELPHE